MSPMILRKGCDSYSHANPQTLKALGLSFCWRYLLGAPGKDLTAGEAQALHAAGIDIILNAEVDTTDGSGGFSQGVAYATKANNQADALGAPQTAVIVYSVDADRTADWVRPYFQGIRSVGRRPAGGYGGTEMVTMLAEGLITVWGQANAGSWSGQSSSNFPTHPQAHFRQHLPVTADGFSFDPQDQMAPSSACSFWLAPANDHPAVLPSPSPAPAIEDEMNGYGCNLWVPTQQDTFMVDETGTLVHRWFDPTHRNPDPKSSGWWRETVTGGLLPRSAVIGPVKWAQDGFIHVFAPSPAGAQIEAVYNLGAVGAKWTVFTEP